HELEEGECVPRDGRQVRQAGLVVVVLSAPELPGVTLHGCEREPPVVALAPVVVVVLEGAASVKARERGEGSGGDEVEAGFLRALLPARGGRHADLTGWERGSDTQLACEHFLCGHPGGLPIGAEPLGCVESECCREGEFGACPGRLLPAV